jgi:Zn-dependent protease
VTEARPDTAAPPRRGLLGGLGAGAALLLGKLKLVALFALKLGKLTATGWTMLLAAWAYALLYGWRFGVGLVVLVFVHEVGHALVAKRLGLPVSAPVFLPFFGAYVKLGRLPRSSWEAALVSLGGPIAGSAAAALCVAAGAAWGGFAGDALFVLGSYALTLNLFNLLPFGFLDGARALAPVPWRAGLAATVHGGFALYVAARASGHLNPVPLLVLAVAAWQLWQRRGRGDLSADHDQVPDVATPAQRHAVLALYFGSVVALTLAVHLLAPHLPRR